MRKNSRSDNDGFTPVQLLKGLVILLVALLWPVVPLVGAAYGLYEVYKLAVLDEWDEVWQLLIGPAMVGAALWYRYGRSREFERGGSNWLPEWIEKVFTALLVVCLLLFAVAVAMDLARP